MKPLLTPFIYVTPKGLGPVEAFLIPAVINHQISSEEEIENEQEPEIIHGSLTYRQYIYGASDGGWNRSFARTFPP
jgi:hypothetical protein